MSLVPPAETPFKTKTPGSFRFKRLYNIFRVLYSPGGEKIRRKKFMKIIRFTLDLSRYLLYNRFNRLFLLGVLNFERQGKNQKNRNIYDQKRTHFGMCQKLFVSREIY
jgi:hypothetical protein